MTRISGYNYPSISSLILSAIHSTQSVIQRIATSRLLLIPVEIGLATFCLHKIVRLTKDTLQLSGIYHREMERLNPPQLPTPTSKRGEPLAIHLPPQELKELASPDQVSAFSFPTLKDPKIDINTFIRKYYDVAFAGEGVNPNDFSQVEEFLLEDNHRENGYAYLNSLFINTYATAQDVAFVESVESMQPATSSQTGIFISQRQDLPILGWDFMEGLYRLVGEAGMRAKQNENQLKQRLLIPLLQGKQVPPMTPEETKQFELDYFLLKKNRQDIQGERNNTIVESSPQRIKAMHTTMERAVPQFKRRFIAAGIAHLVEQDVSELGFQKGYLQKFEQFLKGRNAVVLIPKKEMIQEVHEVLFPFLLDLGSNPNLLHINNFLQAKESIENSIREILEANFETKKFKGEIELTSQFKKIMHFFNHALDNPNANTDLDREFSDSQEKNAKEFLAKLLQCLSQASWSQLADSLDILVDQLNDIKQKLGISVDNSSMSASELMKLYLQAMESSDEEE